MVIALKKEKLLHKLLLVSALLCFVTCIVLVVWYFISEINYLEVKYWQYVDWLTDLENQVAMLENKWLIIIVILLLYFILTAFPVFPISILCVATAMVFNFAESLVINSAGLAILFAVRYSTGMSAGGGSAQWLVRRSRFTQRLFESEGHGNPWVLAVMRLLPFMPINPTSHLYGALDFPFGKFMAISLSCFLPKIVCYIIIGNSFANPFATDFIIPMIIMSLVSGIVFLMLRHAWDLINKVKR